MAAFGPGSGYLRGATDHIRGVEYTHVQAGFRFRTGDTVGLNVNSGWEAAVNTDATTITQDQIFRLRFEITGGDAVGENYGIEYRYNDGGGFGSWYGVGNNATPDADSSADGQRRVQAVPSAQYADGDATTQVIGSGSFVAGDGNETNLTPDFNATTTFSTEQEFALLIRKLSEEGHVAAGDIFEFRLAGSSVSFTYTQTPSMTVANWSGNIGGASIETPNRCLIHTTEGDLYTIAEYCDITGGPFEGNNGVMMKSSDKGVTWTPQDEAGAPTKIDYESLDMVLVGDVIHMIQQGHSGDDVYYFTYNTAGHGTPDEWVIINEELHEATDGHGQIATCIVRSDSTIVAFYSERGGGSDNETEYRIRSSGGTWDPSDIGVAGKQIYTGFTATHDANGVMAVADSTGLIHLFYIFQDQVSVTSGVLHHKTLTTGDVLSPNTTTAGNTAATGLDGDTTDHRLLISAPVTFTDSGTEKVAILFAKNDGSLHIAISATASISFSTEQVTDGSTGAVLNPIGSQTFGGGLTVDTATDELHAVWVDDTTKDIMHDTRVSGSWGTDVAEISSPFQFELCRPTFFTHTAAHGSAKAIGIISDSTTAGGTGKQRYDEIELASGDITANASIVTTSALSGAASVSAGGMSVATTSTLSGAPAIQAGAQIVTTSTLPTAGISVGAAASVVTTSALSAGATVGVGASVSTTSTLPAAGVSVVAAASVVTTSALSVGASVGAAASVVTTSALSGSGSGTGGNATANASIVTTSALSAGASISAAASVVTTSALASGATVETGASVVTTSALSVGASVGAAASVVTTSALSGSGSGSGDPSATANASIVTTSALSAGVSVGAAASVVTTSAVSGGASVGAGASVVTTSTIPTAGVSVGAGASVVTVTALSAGASVSAAGVQVATTSALSAGASVGAGASVVTTTTLSAGASVSGGAQVVTVSSVSGTATASTPAADLLLIYGDATNAVEFGYAVTALQIAGLSLDLEFSPARRST